ncbi:MAG: NAAT family transporter [Phycisphaerales bacterium]|nr:NAAT family transporter [Phycisphaerales bacterium]
MDSAEFAAYIAFIVSVIAVMNPMVAIPVYLSVTEGFPEEVRRRIPRKTAFAAFVIMLVAFLLGETILSLFSVSIPALRIAGGLILASMAWSMLQAKTSRTRHTDEEAQDATNRDAVAIVPLAIPVSAGPGAISLMIIAATYPNPIEGKIAIIVAVMFVCGIVWFSLSMAERIQQFLGTTGMNVVTRIMGLIMLAVAMEFLTGGLSEKFPGLVNKTPMIATVEEEAPSTSNEPISATQNIQN